jgi:hypothetical protein
LAVCAGVKISQEFRSCGSSASSLRSSGLRFMSSTRRKVSKVPPRSIWYALPASSLAV